MSVVFVTNSLGRGGSERKAVQLANGLSRKGISTGITYLQEPSPLRSLVDTDVHVSCLHRTGKFSVTAVHRLRSLIRDLHADSVVGVNPHPCLYAWLARATLGSEAPRLIASINTTEFANSHASGQMWLYAPILRTYDLVIFGAETQRRLWNERYGFDRARTRTAVLYNGVDTSAFCPNPGPETGQNRSVLEPTTFGTIGAFRPEKGQIVFLQALADLRRSGRNVHGLLVGDGPERPRILRAIQELGLGSCVELVGEVADVRPLLSRMDVFVLPSIAVETFSNAALEAMAMRVPVIVTDVGGMPEMVSGGGGIVCPANNVAALTFELQRLADDQGLRTRLANEARQISVDKFGLDRMIVDFSSLL